MQTAFSPNSKNGFIIIGFDAIISRTVCNLRILFCEFVELDGAYGLVAKKLGHL